MSYCVFCCDVQWELFCTVFLIEWIAERSRTRKEWVSKSSQSILGIPLESSDEASLPLPQFCCCRRTNRNRAIPRSTPNWKISILRKKCDSESSQDIPDVSPNYTVHFGLSSDHLEPTEFVWNTFPALAWTNISAHCQESLEGEEFQWADWDGLWRCDLVEWPMVRVEPTEVRNKSIIWRRDSFE